MLINSIVMCLLFGHLPIVSVGIIFCFMYTTLPFLMFLLVDYVQRRFQSRQIAEVTGLVHSPLNLRLFVIFIILIYLVIPSTLKFSYGFILFYYTSYVSFILFFLVLVYASTIALVAFAKI